MNAKQDVLWGLKYNCPRKSLIYGDSSYYDIVVLVTLPKATSADLPAPNSFC